MGHAPPARYEPTPKVRLWAGNIVRIMGFAFVCFEVFGGPRDPAALMFGAALVLSGELASGYPGKETDTPRPVKPPPAPPRRVPPPAAQAAAGRRVAGPRSYAGQAALDHALALYEAGDDFDGNDLTIAEIHVALGGELAPNGRPLEPETPKPYGLMQILPPVVDQVSKRLGWRCPRCKGKASASCSRCRGEGHVTAAYLHEIRDDE